jgi:hypothetical protein
MVRRFRRLTAGLARVLLAGLCLARCAPSPATTPDLVYYGGPVVSHARIVPVNWNSNVDATLQAGLPEFYADLSQSRYWDLLAQYSTAGLTPPDTLPGSGQLIARGSVNAAVTLDPAACPASVVSSCLLAESDIDTELNLQIDQGLLPAPALDATGNVDTVYMINFPANVQVQLAGTPGPESCVDFCSANTTLVRNALNVALGIVMDYSAGSGCGLGCGSAPSALSLATVNAGNALANAVTDPQLGLADTVARPLAWLDSNTGQVAEFCGSTETTLTSLDGLRTWTIGEIWSSHDQLCAASQQPWFSITPSPASAVVNQGGSVPVTMATATPGPAQSITLIVNNLPTGLTAAFDPPSVTGGESSTLTISADETATPATLTVDVGGKQTAPGFQDYVVASLTLTVRADSVYKNGFD